MLDPADAVVISTLSADIRRRAFDRLRELARRGKRPSRYSLDAVIAAASPSPSRAALRMARERAVQALGYARGLGATVLTFGSPGYPAWLATIDDPPAVLWVRGQLSVLEMPAVAIVGSRAATSYAVDVAERLACDLADREVVVVSGLARGVDAAAHRGALTAAEGRTVAVLGSGIDVMYPAEHGDLAEQIVARGALVSEFLPGTQPLAAHFPRRNRVISGLSRAVVVVEAAERSGALITARCALEQGRDVMAVPGNALSGRNRGGHGLLKDGAKVVEDADDILQELGLIGRSVKEESAAGSPGAQVVLDALRPGETHDLDTLVQHTGLDGASLLAGLLRLELEGRVRRVDGGRFRSVVRKVVT